MCDLGSANNTLVNDKVIQEQRLRPHDRITIGDSVLKVISDGSGALPATDSIPVVKSAGTVTSTPVAGHEVDLGLAGTAPRSTSQRSNIRLVLLLVALASMSVVVAWIFLFLIPSRSKARNAAVVQPKLEGFDLKYEKVEASGSNIFQYVLEINDGRARLELHDLANKRHFSGPKTEVKSEVLAKLTRSIQDTGFFALQPEYIGHATETFNLRNLSVTVGPTTHRTRILNATAPAEFENVRGTIEEFGLNEFGVRAWAYPREELIRLANDSMRLGMKLYDEKNVRYENLYQAIHAFKEANIYLETVDPKPDFFQEAISLQDKCEKELKDVCKDLWFQADRSIKVKDWQEAATVLQTIIATIPDRADKEHEMAEQRLADVQRRIGR